MQNTSLFDLLSITTGMVPRGSCSRIERLLLVLNFPTPSWHSGQDLAPCSGKDTVEASGLRRTDDESKDMAGMMSTVCDGPVM